MSLKKNIMREFLKTAKTTKPDSAQLGAIIAYLRKYESKEPETGTAHKLLAFLNDLGSFYESLTIENRSIESLADESLRPIEQNFHKLNANHAMLDAFFKEYGFSLCDAFEMRQLSNIFTNIEILSMIYQEKQKHGNVKDYHQTLKKIEDDELQLNKDLDGFITECETANIKWNEIEAELENAQKEVAGAKKDEEGILAEIDKKEYLTIQEDMNRIKRQLNDNEEFVKSQKAAIALDEAVRTLEKDQKEYDAALTLLENNEKELQQQVAKDDAHLLAHAQEEAELQKASDALNKFNREVTAQGLGQQKNMVDSSLANNKEALRILEEVGKTLVEKNISISEMLNSRFNVYADEKKKYLEAKKLLLSSLSGRNELNVIDDLFGGMESSAERKTKTQQPAELGKQLAGKKKLFEDVQSDMEKRSLALAEKLKQHAEVKKQLEEAEKSAREKVDALKAFRADAQTHKKQLEDAGKVLEKHKNDAKALICSSALKLLQKKEKNKDISLGYDYKKLFAAEPADLKKQLDKDLQAAFETAKKVLETDAVKKLDDEYKRLEQLKAEKEPEQLQKKLKEAQARAADAEKKKRERTVLSHKKTELQNRNERIEERKNKLWTENRDNVSDANAKLKENLDNLRKRLAIKPNTNPSPDYQRMADALDDAYRAVDENRSREEIADALTNMGKMALYYKDAKNKQRILLPSAARKLRLGAADDMVALATGSLVAFEEKETEYAEQMRNFAEKYNPEYSVADSTFEKMNKAAERAKDTAHVKNTAALAEDLIGDSLSDTVSENKDTYTDVDFFDLKKEKPVYLSKDVIADMLRSRKNEMVAPGSTVKVVKNEDGYTLQVLDKNKNAEKTLDADALGRYVYYNTLLSNLDSLSTKNLQRILDEDHTDEMGKEIRKRDFFLNAMSSAAKQDSVPLDKLEQKLNIEAAKYYDEKKKEHKNRKSGPENEPEKDLLEKENAEEELEIGEKDLSRIASAKFK